ncbi:Arginase/deacetylase [Byssothecium circinans]|uniref:Arginase/deacetylase n=1 Tax=Byssothecium circinans TaxID=147558 RepID=A0A6A5TCV6_9PLEO|nr:Arginase/deacetylase [Byssothecium circinans]
MAPSPRTINIINIPSDIGSMYAGKSRAPAAFASAGLQRKLQAAGHPIKEYGAFSPFTTGKHPPVTTTVWKPSSRQPNGARNEKETVEACHRVKTTITSALSDSNPRVNTREDGIQTPEFQLILSGECLYTPAILSAYAHHFNPPSPPCTPYPQAEAKIGIIYIDADTDLHTPADPAATGTIASMTLTHLTLRPGALASMTPFSLPNGSPVVDSSNIVLFGTNLHSPANQNPEHLAYLFDNGFRVITSDAVQKDAGGKAAEALRWMEDRVDYFVVHLDVDVIDPGEFPLCNVPNWTGTAYEQVMASVRVFLGSRKVVALSVAEVNPDHDPGLGMTRRLVDDLVGALGG